MHKCQVVDDQRRQEHAVALQAKLLSSSPSSMPSTPYEDLPPATAAFSPPSSTGSLPPGEQSQHQHLLQQVRNRGRAGSASAPGDRDKPKDVLNDLASQGKRGINAFISRLGGDRGDRGDDVLGQHMEGEGLQRRGTTQSQKPGMAIKGVKAKREADDAGESVHS